MKKNSKLPFLIFFLFLVVLLISEEVNLNSYLHNFLQQDTEYAKELNKLRLLKANRSIRRSDDLFDVNFDFNSYENEINRDQTDYKFAIQTENSDISETDEQMSVSISKKFFEKDFDSDSDNISSSLDLLRLKYELKLYKIQRLNEIINNFISYNQASMNLDVLQEELTLSEHRRELTEKLYDMNIATADELSGILKKIAETEKEISEEQQILNRFSGFSDQTFFDLMLEYSKIIHFEFPSEQIITETQKMKTKLQKDIKKQSTLINLRYLYLYFPETSLNFSYNKRATNQDWIIAEDDNEFEGDTKFYNRKRSLKEEYPEIGIKFSMPINLYSSIKGKVNLLKSFEKEVQIRETELTSETDIFAANLVTEYNKNKKMYELQKKIFELNEKSFNNLSQKYLIEPSILSITPEETLKQKELDLKKEEIDLITAEMHLKKIMFICLKFIGN